MGVSLCVGVVVLLYVVLCGFIFVQLQPIAIPFVDEDNPVVARFNGTQSGDFFFGLATAPAHVEDKLDDAWLDFARGRQGVLPVRAWHNIPEPAERLKFWSNPEVELGLARDTGVSVFRLGVDWGRIVIAEPVKTIDEVVDKEAVEHYKWILKSVREHGMRVMLTLFHHSIPKWALHYGGWTDPRTIKYFVEFTRFVDDSFGEYVDYWVTFNEPHIFVLLTHCSGTWPPGVRPSFISSLFCFSPFGAYGKSIRAISAAHIGAYKVLHERKSTAVVGVAHHVGVIKPYGLLDVPFTLLSKLLTQFHWIDHIQEYLDFCGINYYGQEILSAAGLMLDEEEEYSEAGRGVYPNGLFEVLKAFYDRYKERRPQLRYIVTENGFSDARDIIRRPYLIEHLLAVSAAIQQGIPVDGYVHWTISDNWEWADGYCPKFGLVSVDRSNGLKRTPRPSYYLYQEIVKTRKITREKRKEAWSVLQEDIRRGGVRPFCRRVDGASRMWADGLDTSVFRNISDKDWRFNKYQPPGFVVHARRSLHVLQILLRDGFAFFSKMVDLGNEL